MSERITIITGGNDQAKYNRDLGIDGWKSLAANFGIGIPVTPEPEESGIGFMAIGSTFIIA